MTSKQQHEAELFRKLTGTIVMLLADIRRDRSLFAPPMSCAWLANHDGDAYFMRVLRNYIKAEVANGSNQTYEEILKNMKRTTYLRMVTDFAVNQTLENLKAKANQQYKTPLSARQELRSSTEPNEYKGEAAVVLQDKTSETKHLESADVISYTNQKMCDDWVVKSETTISLALDIESDEESPRDTVDQTAFDLKDIFDFRYPPVRVSYFDYERGYARNDVQGLITSFNPRSDKVRRRLTRITSTFRFNLMAQNTSFEEVREVVRGGLFDLTIYAPPCSGQRAFIESSPAIFLCGQRFEGRHMHTNHMYIQEDKTSYVTVTDIWSMHCRSAFSIAILPDYDTYVLRMQRAGVETSREMYELVTSFLLDYDILYLTNSSLTQAMEALTDVYKSVELGSAIQKQRCSILR